MRTLTHPYVNYCDPVHRFSSDRVRLILFISGMDIGGKQKTLKENEIKRFILHE